MNNTTFQATEGLPDGYEGVERTTLEDAAKDAASSSEAYRIDEFDGDTYVGSYTPDGRQFADYTGQPT